MAREKERERRERDTEETVSAIFSGKSKVAKGRKEGRMGDGKRRSWSEKGRWKVEARVREEREAKVVKR